MLKFFRFHIDLMSFSASMLCAIHCLTVPVLLLFFSWRSLAWLANPMIEAVVWGMSIILATTALLPGYYRHRSRSAIQLAVTGLTLVVLGHLALSSGWQIAGTSIGAAVVAVAHFQNWKLLEKIQKTVVSK